MNAGCERFAIERSRPYALVFAATSPFWHNCALAERRWRKYNVGRMEKAPGRLHRCKLAEEQTVPDFKDDIPDPESPDLEGPDPEGPDDGLSGLELPDFQADDGSDPLAAEEAEEAEEAELVGVGQEESEPESAGIEGFDPMAFDDTEIGEVELEEEEPEEKEEEAAEKKPGLLAKLADASPYTVMLGLTLIALFLGILALAIEWGSYNWDIKAEEARQRTSMIPVAAPAVVESAYQSDAVLGA